MKLQLALDTLTLEEAEKLLSALNGTVDIAEVGTPMLMRYGVRAIETLKKNCPGFTVLADGKIMDGGEYEASMLFEAGADIVTVLGAAGDATVRGAVRAAQKYGGTVMADLIEVRDYVQRAKELVSLGVGLICVHNGYDIKNSSGMDYLGQLREVNRAVGAERTVMAGGVNPGNIEKTLAEGAEIAVCGEYIVTHSDPVWAAKNLKAYFR